MAKFVTIGDLLIFAAYLAIAWIVLPRIGQFAMWLYVRPWQVDRAMRRAEEIKRTQMRGHRERHGR